jgi:dihydroflavonol-4-reductase
MMKSAFVTGATGLLGNNLVRELVARNVTVRALARSREKACRQFSDLPVEVIEGDMTNVAGFARALAGCDALFHTAAHFRDSYKGGSHWDRLYAINVEGTEKLLAAAYEAGIRRVVHTSSIAVLQGRPGQITDETMERAESNADDYFRSKILADRVVKKFLRDHPDMYIVMVLPGWMFGPGDMGPTSSGQMVLDFVERKLPGRVPGSFSVVDARDVVLHLLAALDYGRNGERYLAAGRHMTIDDLFRLLGDISGVAAPKLRIPLFVLKGLASLYELYGSVAKKPILLSRATVRLIEQEFDRTRFDHTKSETELGCCFRPVTETLSDTINWYWRNGFLPGDASEGV